MLKRAFFSLVAWQLCPAAAVLVTLISGSEIDKSVVVPCVVAGFVVAAAVTLAVRRAKRGPAAMLGFGVGLLPSLAGITYGWYFAHKGADAAAGCLALGLWLALPIAADGALSGFTSGCRHRNPTQLV